MIKQFVAIVRNPDIQFIRDLFYLAGGQFISKVVGFFLFVYLARILPPEDYGMVEYLLAITGFAIIFVDFGLGRVGVRERMVSSENDNIVNEIPAIRGVFSLIVTPVVILGIFVSTEDQTARILGSLFATTILLNSYKQEWLMQSLESLDNVALGQLLRILVMAGLTVVLVASPDDLIWLGLAELLSVAVWMAFFVWFQTRSGFSILSKVSWPRFKVLVAKAAPLGLNSIVWGVVQYFPPILIANVSGLEQAAFYSAGQRIVLALQSISYTYHFNLYATLIRRLEQGGEQLVHLNLASIKVVAWAVFGPVIFISGYGSEIYSLTFGEAYHRSGAVLSILIFVFPLHILSGHHRWILTAMGQTNAVFISGAAGSAVSVVLGSILIVNFGATGGAISIVAATATVWALAIVLCNRHGVKFKFVSQIVRPMTVAVILLAVAKSIGSIPWELKLTAVFVLYYLIGLIVDRKLVTEIKYLAYSKMDSGPKETQKSAAQISGN
ncbi:MAG: flippase [Paracoccaceae bacterium]